MKALLRWSALGFAIFSVMYWEAILMGRQAAKDLALSAYDAPLSRLAEWIWFSVPAIIFAMVSVLFCHWLARRVARYRKP